MRNSDPVSQRYLGSSYAESNPTWDSEDSPWKASQVVHMLRQNRLTPQRLVEVGCGAGNVLAALRPVFPHAELHGYDIAPDAARLWPVHAAQRIHFYTGDFLQSDTPHFDTLLLLDVLEHLADPFEFLVGLQGRADYFIFHIPLDLSALSVLRESPLLHVRDKVGHIHYFTKGLALALLKECRYQVMDWRYTGASVSGPRPGWKTWLAGWPRRLAYIVNKDVGVRLLGGETLMVLAKVLDPP